jgi:small subunit ribosomal protein S15
MDKKTKEKIIKKFRTHESDTGSSQVQIAILSAEIKELTEHLKIHKKDHSSRRGLLRKVSERRRLLRYLEHEDQGAFEDLVKKLKLKIAKRYDAAVIEAAEKEAADEAIETDEEEDLDS